jgi:hypothetical protein
VNRTSINILCLGAFAFTLISHAGAAQHFFSEPDAPFIVSAEETVVRVVLRGAIVVGEAQAAIDAARAKSPDAVIIFETRGPVQVMDTPLRLGSRMCLQFSEGGEIFAAENCTAPSLIEIKEAESVAILSDGPGMGFIDGRGKTLTGISVKGGARINLDRLAVKNCGAFGIDYSGRDAASYNQAASVTRCHFENNADGLKVANTGAFQCLDNVFEHNAGTALIIESRASVVAGNTFSGNKAAIRSASDRGVIARNRIADQAALELTAEGEGNLVTENIGTGAAHQLAIAGSNQQIFRNDLPGKANLDAGAKDIFVIGNAKLSIDPSAPGLRLFNPPTFGHPHQDPVIVAGMGRFDLPVITGGKLQRGEGREPGIPAVDVMVAQEALNQARIEHPNDVLVLKLQGEFVSRNPAGLALPPNTCLILDGRILAELGGPLEPTWDRSAEHSQIILLPKTGYSSVSGGTLDGARQAFFPINAKTGSVAVIEGVSLASGAREGINTKSRTKDPIFIYRCNVYANGGRGIWAHVCTRVHSIANNCVANQMDGIDLDAYSIEGTALFNTCTGNRRHGVFIEEGVRDNIAFGNTLNANLGAGVHVWNEEVEKNTGPNVVSANECNANRRGVSVGGRASNKTANGNFFYNNVCRENWLDGILSGNAHGKDNFFSQTVVGQSNEKDINGYSGANALFFNTVP